MATDNSEVYGFLSSKDSSQVQIVREGTCIGQDQARCPCLWGQVPMPVGPGAHACGTCINLGCWEPSLQPGTWRRSRSQEKVSVGPGREASCCPLFGTIIRVDNHSKEMQRQGAV